MTYYKEPLSIEATLTEYGRRFCEFDLQEMGINKSTLEQNSNPNHRNQLSFANALTIEKMRIKLRYPTLLRDMFMDQTKSDNVPSGGLSSLIEAIQSNKKEGEDITRVFMDLFIGGDASLSDLKQLNHEVKEGFETSRSLMKTIDAMIKVKEAT